MSGSTSPSFNACEYLVRRQCDQGRGEHQAVRAPSATLTYAQLDAAVVTASSALRAHLDEGDRVLLVMSDGVPMLTTILGAFRAGIVAVPVSTMLTGSELGSILADSGAKLVVVTPEFAETAGAALTHAPEVRTVITVDAAQVTVPEEVRVETWDDFLRAGSTGPDEQPAATTDDSQALWLYTSGTTGKPKAAMHRHANIRAVCETYGHQVLGITRDDLTFSVAKMFFAYGIGNTVFFPLSVGATTVLEPRRPSPEVVLERLRGERPTLFFGVPTFFAALVASDLPDDAFASVRYCASAGEPLPAPLQRRFTDRFGVEILDGIGSTEALHIFLSNSPGDIRPGTTGRPVPGYQVEVRTDAGELATVGQPGALFVRGDSVALGYWHRPEATELVFRDGWLSTGDTYVCDDEGYYRCLGRNSDMMKAGGIWVSPAEVESRLLEHSAVRQAAVVGVSDSDGLDKPVAVVVADGVLAPELISWCREGLAHFKAPRQVVFVDDLPKTATGKLQRFKVRALLVEGVAVGAGTDAVVPQAAGPPS